ncbi:3-aminobutyryl-CoA aminotransferase [subsurface metagenome]
MNKNRVKKSWELFEVAKTLIPGGVQKSRHPSGFAENYPIFMERGKGSHIYDVDGNEYIDWLLSYGPIVLGHCYSKVDQAVIEEIKKGFLFDLTHPLQLKLAEKLIEIIPCAGKVLFVNTGSGTTSAAIRIARIYTGRNMVVRWGYHGWHDWSCPNQTGIPRSTLQDVVTFTYNDLDSLQNVLEKNKKRVACIIMMPFQIELPKPGFLEGVRELANAYGVVLIFDEIRSWPRMGLGGAQKYYDVTPDMTTLSKGIANGYPISAVVGKEDIMMAAEKTTISATYFPSTLGIAAALATIQELENNNVINHLWKIGEHLSRGLKEIVESKRVRADVIGLPIMPFLIFGNKEDYEKIWYERIYEEGDPGTEEDKKLMRAFYSETIKRGVFFHPRHHWFSCLSHTDEDVKKTLQVAEQALAIAKKT